MELLSIQGDEVTIRLNPRDCLRLGQACTSADHALGGASVSAEVFGLPADQEATPATVDLQQMYAGLAAFFRTAAVAAWEHYDQPDLTVRPERIERVERELLRPESEEPAAD